MRERERADASFETIFDKIIPFWHEALKIMISMKQRKAILSSVYALYHVIIKV